MRKSRLLLVVPAVFAATTIAALAQQTEHAQGMQQGPHHMDPAMMHKMMCDTHYATTVAHLAGLEAVLDLNAQQKGLWDKWAQPVIDHAKAERKECQAGPEKDLESLTALDIEARMEKRTSEAAAQLKASRPALEALYNGLNADQKKMLDHAARHHEMEHEGGHGHEMMHHEMHGEHGEGESGH